MCLYTLNAVLPGVASIVINFCREHSAQYAVYFKISLNENLLLRFLRLRIACAIFSAIIRTYTGFISHNDGDQEGH